MSCVSDSSPLIALEAIGRLDLLRAKFGRISIPPAVEREVRRFPLPPWVEAVRFPLTSDAGAEPSALGPGETEAIQLARALSAQWLLTFKPDFATSTLAGFKSPCVIPSTPQHRRY